jgi:ATP synthase protein I
MSYAAKVLQGTARRVLTTQALLVLAAAFGFLAYGGVDKALAAAFGGGIALLNTLVSAHRLVRASEAAPDNVNRGMLELYIGAVTRFVATPALVAVGIVLLKLDPPAIIVGFVAAQVGYFFNGARPHGQQN